MQVSENFAKVMRGVSLAFAVVLLAFVLSDITSPHQPVSAQNAGVVGIQAQMIPVFSAQSTTKSSHILKDIGQGTNLLFYCGTGFIGTIDLEWNPTPATSSTFYPITQANYVNSDSSCHTLPFGSYFPNLRSTVTISAGSINAWYTAISGPSAFAAPAIGTAGPTAPVTCDQSLATTVGSGATSSIATQLNTGDAVVICGMSVSFAAAPSAGQLIIEYGAAGCATLQSFASWEVLTSATTPIEFAVPYAIRNGNFPRQDPCLINGSGVSVVVSVSYASVHLP